MNELDFRNTNTLWCGVLAETLARCGVTQAVVSPGSRSTPLTMALARHERIEAIPVLDERSAAFFALGLAKRSGRPAVLVCTSGSAGANYFPAVIEAHESGVPLIVITADRPPEMRDCGSGQTIDQQKLFGGFVRFYHEFAVPGPRMPLLRYLRQTLAHAVDRARRGPVHLNAPFRDPLPPIEDDTAKGLRTEDWEGFFTELFAPTPETVTGAALPDRGRGLIVAGPAQPVNAKTWSDAVWRLARARGWPVLADALNPLRSHATDGEPVVTTYDVLLRSETLAGRLKPEFVVCVENWPTSKVLRAWIENLNVPVVMVTASEKNREALHGSARWIRCGIEDLPSTSGGEITTDTRAYAKAWADAEQAGRKALDDRLASEGSFEGNIVGTLARSLPIGTPVVIANSMPVRDAEYFWPANDRRLRVFASRGANGIDGTLSTALGLAHGNAPAVLLTGDLALLHDANGFLSVPQLNGSLTIVVVNNGGGGIFNHLPVAQFDPPFEKYWATPQAVDFEKLCAAHGAGYVRVEHTGALEKLIRELPVAGVRVLEMRTDRARDAAFRKQLFADVAGLLTAS